MLKSLIIALAFSLPVLSCGAAEDPAPASGAPEVDAEASAPKAKTVALESAVRELRCGCKIDGINKCGNYVKDGDDWLEISNGDDYDLGPMAWCKVKAEIHVKGTVAGERTGDTAHLTTLLVDQ